MWIRRKTWNNLLALCGEVLEANAQLQAELDGWKMRYGLDRPQPVYVERADNVVPLHKRDV